MLKVQPFLLDTKTFWQACDQHYPRFGLAREKWKFGVGSKFIRQGEKNAVKYADEIIVLSKGVQKYFMETYGRETHFIPNGVNRPEVREAKSDHG